MFTLLRRLKNRSAALREASTFTVALVIAEGFYRFHSFSLECLAFLGTWGALSALLELAWWLLRRAHALRGEI